MLFVKTQNGVVLEYPYTISKFRSDNKYTTLPKVISNESMAQFEVYPVTVSDKPIYDKRTQKITPPTEATLVEGYWFADWNLEEKSESEIQTYDDLASDSSRSMRDKLLTDTDWVVIMNLEKGTDIPVEWELYRQNLRDITNNANWPHLSKEDWPVKP
jgi:hypothetical protein